jgi:RES domain-containing protein
MFLWRISNHATLDGLGGVLASARWHTQGRPIVYLAESPAGALTEVLVHLELDVGDLPKSYTLLKAEAPDDLAIRTLGDDELAHGWKDDLVMTRTLGDEWLASRATPLLRVPSVVVLETYNVLLNPEHPDASRVEVLWHQEHPWDRRLLE